MKKGIDRQDLGGGGLGGGGRGGGVRGGSRSAASSVLAARERVCE